MQFAHDGYDVLAMQLWIQFKYYGIINYIGAVMNNENQEVLTMTEVRQYEQKARELRAQAFADMMNGLGRSFIGLFARSEKATDKVAHA